MKQRGPGRSWLLGTGLTIAATLGLDLEEVMRAANRRALRAGKPEGSLEG